MCDFEKKVLDGLKNCGITLKNKKVPSTGVAVSGGADSVSLLLALSNLWHEFNIPSSNPLKVITINHNIREQKETSGDAAFVKQLCEELKNKGRNLECTVVELPRGKVLAEEDQRGQGLEEAARFLRYEAFETFIKENSLSFLCLAHNKNDQLETLLMRFLQGASCESLGGIKEKRDCYIRPLLNIERSEIEAYLVSKQISWRTDSTNCDTVYLRNKIRHKLIPFLDKEFDFWRGGVVSGAQKTQEEAQAFLQLVQAFPVKMVQENKQALIPLDRLKELPIAIQKRVILRACNLCGFEKRITSAFLEELVSCLKNGISKSFATLGFWVKKNTLFIKNDYKIHTDLVFFDIIEETGLYDFPFGILEVNEERNNLNEKSSQKSKYTLRLNGESCAESFGLPFCIRSIQRSDEVMTASGSMKKISDILADWHVIPEHRALIPVLQLMDESQTIKCIFGKFLGYKDWIVK